MRKRTHKKTITTLEKAQVQAKLETAVELLAHRLDHWAHKELNSMVNLQAFVCMDMAKDLYRVGQFHVKKTQNHWTVTCPRRSSIMEFHNMQAAVFYCLYETKCLYQRSSQFFHLDQQLGRAHDQLTQYHSAHKHACKNNDSFRQDLFYARISEAQCRFNHVESSLLKCIVTAKYSKVWDHNYETARTRN